MEEKTRIIQQAQARVVQNEKMASLGALSAVVAHEVNNPLSGVLTYAKLVRKRLKRVSPAGPEAEEIDRYLAAVESETAATSGDHRRRFGGGSGHDRDRRTAGRNARN